VRTNLAALSPVSELAGVLAMIGSCAVFIVGDTCMKLVSATLPPFEILTLRGLAASIACLALILWQGQARLIRHAREPRTLLRAGAETLAILCYILALSQLPIANVVAILQTGPLFTILGAALMLRERIGPSKFGLAVAGFAGAVMVAQPSADGVSAAVVFAALSAILGAARDLAGRAAPAHLPVPVVTLATLLLQTVVAATLTFGLEKPIPPSAGATALLILAALMLVLGHFGLLFAYRLGRTETVAPFFYSLALWALASGLVIFGQWPNALALAGIALIVVSGVVLIGMDRRKARRIALTEAL
jgi:drug/metabolite transporter (DMT)-like permease